MNRVQPIVTSASEPAPTPQQMVFLQVDMHRVRQRRLRAVRTEGDGAEGGGHELNAPSKA